MEKKKSMTGKCSSKVATRECRVENRAVRFCFFDYLILNSSVGSILHCNIFAVSLHQSHHFLCIVTFQIFILHLGDNLMSQFPYKFITSLIDFNTHS